MDRPRFEGVMPVSAVSAFLAALPADRRPAVERVREEVLRHLPDGYEEVVSKNMLVYQVPLERYPDTYNGQPLCHVAITVHKDHLALYLMGAYMIKELTAQVTAAFRAAGKKLDMGKACIRFKTADDLPLPALGQVISSLPPTRYIVRYEEIKKR